MNHLSCNKISRQLFIQFSIINLIPKVKRSSYKFYPYNTVSFMMFFQKAKLYSKKERNACSEYTSRKFHLLFINYSCSNRGHPPKKNLQIGHIITTKITFCDRIFNWFLNCRFVTDILTEMGRSKNRWLKFILWPIHYKLWPTFVTDWQLVEKFCDRNCDRKTVTKFSDWHFDGSNRSQNIVVTEL